MYPNSTLASLYCPTEFCGRPTTPSKHRPPVSGSLVGSWDAFAFAAPLPVGLRQVGNPWFGGLTTARYEKEQQVAKELTALAAAAPVDARRSVFDDSRALLMNLQGAENRVAVRWL
jgi:hypothetical protein